MSGYDPQLLATFLEMPYVTVALSAEYTAGQVVVKRETENRALFQDASDLIV